MPERIPTISNTPDKEGKIQLEEVAELEAPIKKIIGKILSRIESSEYGLIIGDDASGRIPAIILGNFIKKVSEERGISGPDVIFIPGRLKMESEFSWRRIFGLENALKIKQYEELDDYISSYGASKEKKILIITDTVKSGDSLKTLVDLLNGAGYSCDIATIGIETPMIGQGAKQSLRGTDIISGEYREKNRDSNQNTPLIYDHKELSGVKKIPGNHVSEPIKKRLFHQEDRNRIQGQINKSREDANVVIDHLLDWYKALENEK